MTTVRTANRRTHSKAAFGEIESIARGATNTIVLHPAQVRLIHASLVDKVLNEPTHRIIRESGDDRCLHPETSLETACDVVFTAALPGSEAARRRNTSVAWVESQHDLAQGNKIPTTLCGGFDL
jgi:hypothetical protein